MVWKITGRSGMTTDRIAWSAPDAQTKQVQNRSGPPRKWARSATPLLSEARLSKTRCPVKIDTQGILQHQNTHAQHKCDTTQNEIIRCTGVLGHSSMRDHIRRVGSKARRRGGAALNITGREQKGRLRSERWANGRQGRAGRGNRVD